MPSGEAGRALRLTVAACALFAAVAIAVTIPAGHWQAGLGVAVGLLLGSLNGIAMTASLRVEAGFRATSLLRLAVLTALAVAAGILLGGGLVWPVLGVGLAQLVLAAGALRESLRA